MVSLDFLSDPGVSKVIASSIILLGGFIFGRLVSGFVPKALEKTGFLGKVKFGIEREAKKFGVELDLISLISRVLKYLIYLVAVLVAMDMLGVRAASIFLEVLIPFLPQVFAAILILLFGTVVAEIIADFVKFGLRDRIDDAAKEAGVSQSLSTLVASFVKYFLYLFVFLTALLQLGFQAGALIETLVYLTLIFAGAIAIVFILFVKGHLHNLSSWLYLRNSGELNPGDYVSIGRVSGKLEKIGGINTVLVRGKARHFVPNSKFVQETFTVTKK